MPASRKTISKRLLLPFLLFLAPIAFLLVALVQSHQRAISMARNEMAGIPAVLAALTTSRQLLATIGTEPTERDALKRGIVRLRSALDVWVSDPLVKERAEYTLAKLAELVAERNVSVVDIRDDLENLATLIRLVGDVSELILDPDLDTYYYMDMLVVLSPDMISAFRDMLQDIAINKAAGQESVPGPQSFHHAQALRLLIQRKEAAIDKTVRHARDGKPHGVTVAAGRSYVDQLKELQSAWAAGRPTDQMAWPLNRSLESMARWQMSASMELERLLELRAAELQGVRNQQITLSLIMFSCAALFLIWMTRRYVTVPLRKLTTSMIGLSKGAVDTPLPVATQEGEVDDMIRAVAVFKENALRNRILEAEKAEATGALKLSASTLQHAEVIADLGHWRLEAATGIVNWSTNLHAIAGLQQSDAPGLMSSIIRRVGRADRKALVAYLRSVLKDNAVGDFTCLYEHPDLGLRHLKSQVALERQSDGQLSAIMGIVQDVTLARESELALKARSQSLAEAQSIGRIGDWSYRLGATYVVWSPEIFALLKYQPDTFDTTREAVMGLYQGESRERVLEAQAEVMRTGEVRAVDVQALLGDGKIADFTVTSKADSDERGNVIGFSGTIQDISERKSAERELEKLAYFDPLTGLANRALFQRTLRRELDRLVQNGSSGALLLLDLDRFKEVNDSLGHAAGDELLVRTAESLKRHLPASAFLSRLGGDEFAIVLTGCDRDGASRVGADVVRLLAEPVELKLGEVQIGASIGAVMIPEDGTQREILLRNADLALYQAKDDGRSCTRFFTSELSDTVQEKTAIAKDLRRALAVDDQLFVVFQPQVDLRVGRVSGFEALLRWRHPVRGLIPPSAFIPIAESSSLIADLGLYVLRASCMQMKQWIDAGHPARDVAVNVSPAQIWQSDFESDVKQVLMEADLPPHYLTLEVTEGVFIREAEGRVGQALNGLKALGVKLALDDFGTGYSSLGYLNRLPFDKLKIDRRFIAGVHRNPERLNLLKGIIELGLGLGMTTVAEGAELMEEVRALRSLNCHVVQGYVFSHPLEGDSAMRAAAVLDMMVPANNGPRSAVGRKAA
jgi:diguanylate cyclase (GGDEF)-like protein